MSETLDSPPAALSGGGVARAAGLLVIGFVLSRLLGLAREIVLASVFGASTDYEAYTAALRPPDTLYLVVAGGALGSAFIPTFAAYLAGNNRREAWRLAGTIATLITIVLAALAALLAVFARPVVALTIGVGFEPAAQALTARLMQIMLLTPAIFGLSGLLMGILNSHQRFLLPALAPALYNLGILFGAGVLSRWIGIYGPAWGAVIGALLHLIVQIPGLIALRPSLAPSLDVRHPGVREVARLIAPRMLGLAVVQINFWVNLALASTMAAGSVAALARAWFVLLLPQGVIAQSLANAVFPTFSLQAARGDSPGLQRTLGQALRAVLFLSIPASVGLALLRLPIIRLLFERGEFRLPDSQAAAWALLFYDLGLVAHSLVEVVTRAFYALHDTRTPVIVGGGAMLLNVALSFTLIRFIGEPGTLTHGPFAGLALANTLATSLEGLILLALIRPRVGGLDGPRLLAGVGRALLASAGMGVVLWLCLPLIDRAGLLIGTLAALAAGGAVFGGLAWLLGSEEARLFAGLALRRLRRPATG